MTVIKSLFQEYPDLFHATNPQCSISDFRIANHIHDKYELSLCSSGNIIVDSSNLHVMITAPCLLLHKPYTVHLVNSDRIVPYKRQIIYFDREFLANVDPRLADPDRVFTSGFRGIPISALELARLKQLMDPLTSDMNKHLRLPLLIAILREIEHIAPENGISGDGGLYIGEVMKYIRENLSEPLDSNVIAEHFFISRTKLDRDFRFYTQMTVRKFLTNVRLRNALKSMRSGMTVAGAAACSGFGDVSHFIRTFRQIYGMTPKKYIASYGSAGECLSREPSQRKFF